ncbi:thioesterase domain-containing protein [Mesorhizobium sp. BAC0120]|uniref:thioesterase domain-containing protein n=1 Tax=Mesorhizobium sp. BAC0120 TaxID=3090670 RepID=UPI00298D33D6|nr:thioesterase domain-containing protein [Mesorhizobium sp. BAC0120]MDW6021578.1 thioesterase domain-containing protein [Mesorhizobium sp. BAC0120]
MDGAAVLESSDCQAASSGGARVEALPLELLRDGTADEIVFLFPGLGGDAREMAPLAGRLATPGRIFGVSYLPQSGKVEAVASLAASAVATLRFVQPGGPYRLVGYSFGALVAVEVARQLKRAGERLAAPILIDAYYDQKFWPAKAWWLGQARRTGVQLARIGKLSPGPALRELMFRAGRLTQRLWSRWRGSLPKSGEPAPTTGAAANATALQSYDPPFYSGSLILLSATDSTMFGCRPSDLWRGRSGSLVTEDVAGNHFDLVRNPASLERLARAVDRHLDPSGRAHQPVALIVTTFRWPATAGLAAALTRAGFRVVAFCSRRHPMRRQSRLVLYRIPWRHREHALKSLVARVDPDLVLPCDEPALGLVRNIGVGDQGSWPDLTRSQIIEIACASGVEAPPARFIDNVAELDKWIEAHGLPVALKTDGSWGGRGVAIAQDRAQAVRMWRRLSHGPGLFRTMKRAIVNGDSSFLRDLWRGRKPQVNAQVYVAGRDANVALAVKNGKVLAAVAVEVLETRYKNGPAKVVRVIDHPGILLAACKVMERLRLTGLVGIDFILDANGTAHLIEVNARVTPTCRLALGGDRDPVAALRSSFPGAAAPAVVPSSFDEVIDLDALD